MKKTILTLTTACFFAAAALFTFSTNSTGHFSLFKKAQAIGDNKWIPYFYECPSQIVHIIVTCGAGGNGCFPTGNC
jgi:hypothetical protein